MSACVYFTRLTVDEEQGFLPTSETLLDRLRATASTIPACKDLACDYHDNFGSSVFLAASSYQRPRDLMHNRNIQLVLFTMIAHALEATGELEIVDLGFYSSGVQPALIFAGCVTLGEYFNWVFPFVRENRRLIVATGQERDLVECLLVGEPTHDIEAFVSDTLAQRGTATRVFLKDVRNRNAVLVAGYRNEVIELRALAVERFTAIKSRQPAVHQTDGAHIPIYDRESTAALLSRINLRPPRFRLIGTRGEEIEKGCEDQDRLRTLLADAVAAPMDTGSAMRSIARHSQRTLVIGSAFGSKILHRLDEGLRLRIDLATDIDFR